MLQEDKGIAHAVTRGFTHSVYIALAYGLVFFAQIQYTLFVPFSLLLFSAVAVLIIVKPQTGFYAFVFAGIISETHYLYGYELFHSIYTYKLLSFTLIDWLLFILIARSLTVFLAEGNTRWHLSHWDIGFLCITGLTIVASIWGLLFFAEAKRWFVDIKSMLFFLMPFFIARFYLRNKNEVIFLLRLILITLTSKTFVYFIGYLIKFILFDELVIRVTLTSDLVLYPLLLLVCLSLFIICHERVSRSLIAASGLIIALSIFWSFGRETWFWTIFSASVLLAVSTSRTRTRYQRILTPALLACALLITVMRPQTWSYALRSIETFTLKTHGKGEEETGAVRVIEWINIHKLLVDSNTVIVGRGMGATWSDRYQALPRKRDIYSFPLGETEHVFTHMVFSKYYLKFGVLGSLIFWVSLLLPWLKSLVWARGLPHPSSPLFLSLLIGCSAVFAKLELIRVAFIGGFIFACIACLPAVIELEPERRG